MKRDWKCALLVCGLALIGPQLVAVPQASAQGFLSFLWGGGSREVVSFPGSVQPGQIIVSFGDRKLYWVHRRGEAISYPIAVPREQSRWQGMTTVSDKRVNPGWTPTAEMRRENPRLPVHLPGGHPLNPLGVRALYLGASMYRIHGTDAPWTIGTAVSKGCIRMYNEDVLDLYPRVPIGTKVTVTWRRYTTG
jgi:lipoprotein-anchoring transpeptidase ErfK/SrfK